MKKILGLFLIVLLASSCREYEKLIAPARNNKEKKGDQSFDGQKEPAFPDEDENNKTLQGIDTNNNGIRDDVEIWINYTGKNRNERMALRKLAKKMQELLMYDQKYSKKSREEFASRVWDAMSCVRFFEMEVKPYEGMYPKLGMIIYNSDSRKRAYDNFNHRGISYGPGVKNARAANGYLVCDFEIENLQSIVEKNKKLGYEE